MPMKSKKTMTSLFMVRYGRSKYHLENTESTVFEATSMSPSGIALKFFAEISTLQNYKSIKHKFRYFNLVRIPALLCKLLFSFAAFHAVHEANRTYQAKQTQSYLRYKRKFPIKTAILPPVMEAEKKGNSALFPETLLHNWLVFRAQPTGKIFLPFLRVKCGSPELQHSLH